MCVNKFIRIIKNEEERKYFQKKYKYFSCWLSQKNRIIFLVDFNLIMAELVQVIHSYITFSFPFLIQLCSFVVVSTENVFQNMTYKLFSRKHFPENWPISFGCLVVTLKIGRIYLWCFIEYVTFWIIGLVFCWITFSSVPNTKKYHKRFLENIFCWNKWRNLITVKNTTFFITFFTNCWHGLLRLVHNKSGVNGWSRWK